MIPYFEIHSIPLGPLRLQIWGLFVSIGIILAAAVGRRECRRRGLDPGAFTDLAVWTMVGALIGSRLLYAFAYAPEQTFADPASLLRVWEGGLSSFGGFIGAAVAAMLATRALRLRFAEYADVAAFVLPLGYGCGRIGCFLIHDHPGTLSQSFIAVQYPGGARLDHGLLLSLVGFSLFAIFAPMRKAGIRGIFLPTFMCAYGAVRFVMDFFRAYDLPGADARYVGLTPAQYGSLLLIAGGAFLFAAWHRTKPYVQGKTGR
jgi:phosphatidylglycerol:prolipoprotein diacylglycerol transferase